MGCRGAIGAVMHSVGSTDRETLLSDGVGIDGQTPEVEPAWCLKTVPAPYQDLSPLSPVCPEAWSLWDLGACSKRSLLG